MTPHEYHILANAMEQYGGSFVKSLAKTLRLADPVHKATLTKAFPGIVKHYLAVAKAQEQEKAQP
jgi:hypothetical protein